MINIPSLDKGGSQLTDERELLGLDAENVRTFYSLTGPARREYAIQMAEAEAARIRIVREAQAEGILSIRRAEAEGLRLIGEALEQCQNRDLLAKFAGLMALQEVSQSLADGKATKIFVPQSLGDIYTLITAWNELKPDSVDNKPPQPS